MIITMKSFNIVPSLSLLLVLLLGRTTNALPSGAGNCPGGRAAVGVTHLEGDVTEGTLEKGGITLSLGDQVLTVGEIVTFPMKQDLTWTLNATKRPMRGFLMRAEDRSDDAAVDTREALSADLPFDSDGDDLNSEVQVAETVCINAFSVGGVTHTNNNQKRTVSGTFRMDQPVQELQVDVTIVIANRNGKSIFYYSGFVVSFAREKNNNNNNGDREDNAGSNNSTNALIDVEKDDDDDDDEESDLAEPTEDGGLPLKLRASTCTPENPCDQCEGDCNKNAHCAEGLECFYRPDRTPIPGCAGRGVAGYDYCYLPQNDTLRLRSLECNIDVPCDRCQGSCSIDDDCGENLSCFVRRDKTPVPGCEGRGVVGRNYCYETPLELDEQEQDLLTLRPNECNRTNTCTACEGECFKDGDCQGDLKCFSRRDKTPVPGCSDSFLGVAGRNYCYQPPEEKILTLNDSPCSSFLPCRECEGACTNDNTCFGQLECKRRVGNQTVVGCSGDGISGTNYCFDPSKDIDETVALMDSDINEVAIDLTETSGPTTEVPTMEPTAVPVDPTTRQPTTKRPTNSPTPMPVPPRAEPTRAPTREPTTLRPSRAPVEKTDPPVPPRPSSTPTAKPTRRPRPSSAPTDAPIVPVAETDAFVTPKPTRRPTSAPVTAEPTPNPTDRVRPTPTPTDRVRPTPNPTDKVRTPWPTVAPKPTDKPTLFPEWTTPDPTKKPTQAPLDDVFEEVATLVDSNSKMLRLSDTPCTAANPCNECAGDCNTDAQCAGSLQCFQRPGLTPIPGCEGQGESGKDYCAVNIPATPAPVQTPRPTQENGTPRPTPNLPTPGPTPQPFDSSSTLSLRDRENECSERRPCGECQGDCDKDVECTGALRCFFRVNLEAVPGCAGQGTVGRDYCAFDNAPETTNTNQNLVGPGQDTKLLNTRRDECTERNPCNECQGDCNGDDECAGNLQCFFRIGAEDVPGCNGSGVRGRDYCAWNPAFKRDRHLVRRRTI